MRHARATTVHVDLDVADGGVRLRIGDDGVGLPEAARHSDAVRGAPGLAEP